jgi:CHAT domain-containing protein
VALSVLFGANVNKLIPPAKALDEGLEVVQRASQTAAAAAVVKLAVRLAAGNDRLARVVRRDQDLAAEAETLDKRLVEAVSKEPAKRSSAAELAMRDRLASIALRRESLRKVLAADFPDYAALSNPPTVTAKEIEALLKDDEALILLFPGNKVSHVFVAVRGAFELHEIALDASVLSDKIAQLRRGLDVDMVLDQAALAARGKKRELFDLALAHELYATLLGPVERRIKDKRHLIVVPVGSLTAMPFHLLVTGKPLVASPPVGEELKAEDYAVYRDAAWLMKRHAISVLPSAASLVALRLVGNKSPATKPLIGFADPQFGTDELVRVASVSPVTTRSYGEFWRGAGVDRDKLSRALPRLADSADELKTVASRLGAGPGDINLRLDASETNVKRASLVDYRVIYFATHGLVAGDVKDLAEPALALSLPATSNDQDDGLLTASEVAALKLNADWVVLSACNTAAGDKPGAEALSGFARAFFYAGARALLVSHWSVASSAATRLTTSTFDIINSDPSAGRAEATRRAMLAYLNDASNPTGAYPAFWGPFSVIGEGR